MSLQEQIETLISTDWAQSFKASQSKKEYVVAMRLVLSGQPATISKAKKSKYFSLTIGDFFLESSKKEKELLNLASELNLTLA
jgi:hypothetical protein